MSRRKAVLLAAAAVLILGLVVAVAGGWFRGGTVVSDPNDPYAMVHPQGIPALAFAIQEGDRDEIERYLELGADLGRLIPSERGGGSVAMYWGLTAVMGKKAGTDFFDYLIAHGADVDQISSSGISALHMAAGFGHLESVEKLVALGADVNVRDTLGKTPLIRATETRDAARRQYEKTGNRAFHKTERTATAIIDLLRKHGAAE